MNVGPVRLAVHGCGGHAINHLGYLPPGNILDVVALSDMRSDAITAADAALVSAGRPSPRSICFSLESLLKTPDIEAVYIATPDEFHANEVRMVLESGKHVLAEKPLAVDQRQLYSIGESVDYARERNLVFMTCHPRRFDPRYISLRNHLQKLIEQYGNVCSVLFNFEYPAPKDEWKNKRGLLIDHVSHEVDLLRFILSMDEREPFSLERVTDTALRYEVTGNVSLACITIHFSGDRTERVATWNDSRETLRIIFERGEAFVTSRKPYVFHNGVGETSHKRVHVPTPAHHFEYYRGVVQNFADTIRARAPAYVSDKEMFINASAGVNLTLMGSFVEHFATLPSEDY